MQNAETRYRRLRADLAPFRSPSPAKSTLQLLTSFVPYIGGLVAMALLAEISYWLSLALVLPTAGFMVRTFIIFHDAGHGSLYRQTRWNKVVGWISGIITFTPFQAWTHEHAQHHATAGDLDRRDLGDVWTMTVEEFKNAPRRMRLLYRLFRNPFLLFFLLAPTAYLFYHRIPHFGDNPRARWAVLWTNLGVAGFMTVMSLTLGFTTFLFAFLPVFITATAAGVWLFYVQHQFTGVYWRRNEEWQFLDAALEGSSYLALPPVLQFFTGNIGYHHIHHLDPRIPNYNLPQCHRTIPTLHHAPTLRLRDTLRCLSIRLYDEAADRMVSFREALQPAPSMA